MIAPNFHADIRKDYEIGLKKHFALGFWRNHTKRIHTPPIGITNPEMHPRKSWKLSFEYPPKFTQNQDHHTDMRNTMGFLTDPKKYT